MTLVESGDTTRDETLVNAGPGVLTVWSDIGCPWATLTMHTIHEAAGRRGQDVLVDHRAFPLELLNKMPTPKFILDPEMFAIAACVPALGWRRWSEPDSTYPVTMLPALEAVQAAKSPAVGGLRASDELDTALRKAFYAEARCISIHSVILEVAAECPQVDADALAAALAEGAGRAEVYRQMRVAEGDGVQGSPHLLAPGYAAHNPGATYHWTGEFPYAIPRLEKYETEWAEELLDQLAEK